jgi:hypothetical protein
VPIWPTRGIRRFRVHSATTKGQKYSVHVITVHMHKARSSSCATRREWKKEPFRWLQGGYRAHDTRISKGSAGSNQPGKRSRNKGSLQIRGSRSSYEYYVRVTRKILAASILQPAFVLAAETSATAHPKEPNAETPGTLQLFP